MHSVPYGILCLQTVLKCRMPIIFDLYHSHAPRGNDANDASASHSATPERCRRRYHAERGNDKNLFLTPTIKPNYFAEPGQYLGASVR